MPRLRWRPLLAWSALGTLIGVAFTLVNLATTMDDLGHLVDTKPQSLAAPIVGPELGPDALRDGGDHDGAWFYVIARDPFDLDAAAAHLDGAHYRLQRIGFPMVVWVLHPVGGGWSLVWTMFAVGVAAAFGGGVATGALSATLRGPPAVAVVFPVMIGTVLSLRISVPDPLAWALAVAAVVLVLRGHLVWAVLAGTLAALTREPVLLVFLGLLIARRDRRSLLVLAVPAAVTAAWGVWLRLAVPDLGQNITAFGVPLRGVWDAARFWAQGYEPLGLVSFVVGIGVAVAALVKRGLGHPLGWILALQVAFLALLNVDVLGPERNVSRAVMPLVVFGIVMLVTPRAGDALHGSAPSAAVDADPSR